MQFCRHVGVSVLVFDMSLKDDRQIESNVLTSFRTWLQE